MKKTKKITNPTTSNRPPEAVPFVEHLQELRRRCYYVALSVLAFGAGSYAVQQHIVNYLLRPAHGQHFIYTSPGGGIDFLFKICLYCGLILSTPVIVYNVLGFIEPLISNASKRFLALSSVACGLLAIAGVGFGYTIGLPAALHFLFDQFTTVQIKPLVTIQSYLSFVIAYMLGSALLFQLPVILICVNRIKPLKPRSLLHYERWVILAAFVLAGLMNPSPNLLSQLLIAVPFILMYQLGIILIALVNRRPAEAQSTSSTVPAQVAPEVGTSPTSQPVPSAVVARRPAMTQPVIAAQPQPLAMDSLRPRRQPRGAGYNQLRRPARVQPRASLDNLRLSRQLQPERQRFMDFMPVSSGGTSS